MRQKQEAKPGSAEKTIRDIRGATRRSPLSTVPAGILSRRFRNVHHRRF